MIKHQMFIAAALLAGVAIGYFVKDEPVAAEEPTIEVAPKKTVADKGEDATVRALRHRIAELEKLLTEKDGKSEIAISNAVAEAVKIHQPISMRGNPREWMENLRKNDPERYTQMTNRFANWRRSRAAEARNKIDFLSSIDTSHMSAGARKTHDALQELIASREEIEAQLQNPDLSDEERGKLMHQLRESHGELHRLNGEERKNLIDETARSLGFEGEDAKEISATIREIIETTDSGWGGHRGGHRGLGGPGGR